MAFLYGRLITASLRPGDAGLDLLSWSADTKPRGRDCLVLTSHGTRARWDGSTSRTSLAATYWPCWHAFVSGGGTGRVAPAHGGMFVACLPSLHHAILKVAVMVKKALRPKH